MPTFKSVQLNATAIAPNLPTERGGRVRYDFFSYVLAGTEIANDVIELAVVPLGSRIHKITIFNQDLGTTATLDIGDKDDPDRYANDVAGGTADVFDYGSDLSAGGTLQVPVLVSTENMRIIQLTVVAVAGLTAGAVIQGRVEYVID